MNSIFHIQELIRVLDATFSEINPEGLATGKNAMSIIEFISSVPNLEQFVGTDFMNHIQSECEKAKEQQNVREQVKKILMYPKFSYDPWIPIEIDSIALENIHQKLSRIQFKFSVFDGKVYLIASTSINDLIFECTKDVLPNYVVSNSAASHVTIVNSNIVQDCGLEKVVEFVGNYQDEFSMEFGNIKSTTSNDWSVFSECYVIEVKSHAMMKMIENFNQIFGKTIKPSPHITFAIRPRSLFK